MIINFPAVTQLIIALSAVVGLAVLIAVGIVAAAWLVERDRARHVRPGRPAHVETIAQQPTQTDRVLELASR